MNNLKPCPFCGCQDISTYLAVGEGSATEWAYCPNCYEAVGRAISIPTDLWNTRPIEDNLRESAETLKRLEADARLELEKAKPSEEAEHGKSFAEYFYGYKPKMDSSHDEN
jgi:hypothetical protein